MTAQVSPVDVSDSRVLSVVQRESRAVSGYSMLLQGSTQVGNAMTDGIGIGTDPVSLAQLLIF